MCDFEKHIDSFIKILKRSEKPFYYNGGIVGYPFCLVHFIDLFGKDAIPAELGIYHLFHNDKLIYIGMSKNLRKRLIFHLKDKYMPFNYCLFFPCSIFDITLENVFRIEKNMIEFHKPAFNIQYL